MGLDHIQLRVVSQEGFQRNPQITSAAAKTKGCYSLQTDMGMGGWGCLPRIAPIQLVDNGEVELVPTWSLHPHIFMVRYSCRLPQEKHGHQFSHKTFDLPFVPPIKDARTMQQRTCVSSQPSLI